MREIMRFACALFLGSLACGFNAAQADTISYVYTAGQTTYTDVTRGSVFNVSIFLQEQNGDGSSDSLLATDYGLFGAGVRVTLKSSSDGTATTITYFKANLGGGFDVASEESCTKSSAAVLESASVGVAATVLDNGISTILLGTLTLTASSTPGQTTTFTVDVYDPAGGNTITFEHGYDLDNGVLDSYYSAASTDLTITTSAPASIPLPSTATGGLFLLGGLCMAGFIRRQYRSLAR